MDPSTEATEETGSKRKLYEGVVSDVIVETHDTVTLEFFFGERIDYKAGQFLTIDPHQFDALKNAIGYLEDAKGAKEPPRAYSMGSSPHEPTIGVTVKIEPYVSGDTKYPPLLSPFLVRSVRRGDRIVVGGFVGPYRLPDDIEAKTDHVVHISAGSGIVPNFSMIKFALETGQKMRHTLVYGNKTWDDVIYRQQFDDLQDRYPDKLRVVHALSREKDLSKCGRRDVRQGRVTEPLLRSVVEDPKTCHVFMCGPAITKWEKIRAKEKGVAATPRFLESALEAVAALGIAKDRVHKEAYG